jgi:hypothetical protein
MESISNRLEQHINVGSLRFVYFLPVRAIINGLPHPIVPPVLDIVDVNEMVVDGFEKWFMSEFMADNVEWEQEEEITSNGVLYKDKITIGIAKDYTRRRKNFASMEYEEFAVFISDFNNKGTFFGYQTIEGTRHGMRFKFKKTTGKKRKDTNMFTLTFYMETMSQAYPATYDTEPIVEPPPPTGGGGTLPGDYIPPEA